MAEIVYTLAEFAESVKLSTDQVQKHLNGSLKPRLNPGKSGRKPIFTETERAQFLSDLPRYNEDVTA